MRHLGRILRIGVAVGIVALAARELVRASASFEASHLALRWGPALGSAVAGGLAFLTLALVSAAGARAARLGAAGAPFWRGWLRVWFQGYFYRYVPGKVLLVVERARLAEKLGVPRSASVMLVVWESLLLLAGAGLVAGIGLLAMPRDEVLSAPIVGALAVGCLLGSLALGPATRWAARIPWVGERLPGLVLGVSPAAQIGLVLGNGLAWALLGLSFALAARATRVEPVPDAVLVTWFVASYVGGQVTSVAPAGLGVREGLLVAGLAGVVPAPVALAWAVGHRVLLSGVELLLVGTVVASVRLPDEGG